MLSGLALLDAMLRLVAWVVVFTHHTSHEVQIWEGGGKGEGDSPAIALAIEPGPAQEQARLQVRATISEEREVVAGGRKDGLAVLAGMRLDWILIGVETGSTSSIVLLLLHRIVFQTVSRKSRLENAP